MSHPDIVPVILCGGSGTRLWPLSRKSYPKQFTQLIGDHSLYQQAAARLTCEGFAAPVIVTNSDFWFIVAQQLSAIGIDLGTVLIEPEARNTAPALLAAAIVIAQNDPDALILASPSDHYIQDASQFRDSVRKGATAAAAGQIVTFGITPTRPETGYGYLELDDGAATDADATPLKGFVEKPDSQNAARMIAEGRFLWNSGVFLYSARTLMDAFRTHAPELFENVQSAVTQARSDFGFLRLDAQAWARCDDVSVDFSIMEEPITCPL